MENKIKFFISYKFSEYELFLRSLIDKLKKHNYEVKWAQEFGGAGRDLRKTINNELHSSDILLAFVTTKWLESNETWYEYIQARTLNKPIIILKEDNIAVSDLGWLNEDNLIHINFKVNSCSDENFETIIKQISHGVKWFSEEELECPKLLWNLIQSSSKIRNKDLGSFRKKMIKQELLHTSDEISQISKGSDYSIDIGMQRDFLIRAIPMFKAAKEIYAVSCSNVSTFWYDKNNNDNVLDFIKCQLSADKIFRLFVFNNFNEVCSQLKILNQHFNAYHDRGGVLLCSFSTYSKIIKDFDNLGLVQDSDFGILNFGEEWIKAVLRKSQLSFFVLKNNEKIYARRFESIIEKVGILKDGEISEGNYQILKWCPNLFENNNLFNEKMKVIFNNCSSYIYHCVFILKLENPDCKELLRKKLQEIKTKVGHLINNEYVWFYEGIEFDRRPEDANAFGEIHIPKCEFAMVFKFDKLEALNKYYTDKNHSKIREEIYSLILPSIKNDYAEIRASKIKIEKEHIYKGIEDKLQNYFLRLDIRRNELPPFFEECKEL